MPIFQTIQTPLYSYVMIVRLLIVEVFEIQPIMTHYSEIFGDTHTHTHTPNQTKTLVIMVKGFRVGKNNYMLRGSCVKVCDRYSNSYSIGLLSKSFFLPFAWKLNGYL